VKVSGAARAVSLIRAEPLVPPEVTGVAVLAIHNLAVHRLLPPPADVALNLVTAAGLMAFARRAGCGPGDLGIRAADADAGLRLGLGAAAVAVAAVGTLTAVPATRRFFGDQRLAEHGPGESAYHLVRIPLATALAEELQFRAALLALLRQRRSPAAAVAWTSALFGAWHVLPALDHYHGNPASGIIADARNGRWLAVVATGAATVAAGAAFAWLRLRSRSVLAPALAHAAVNVSAYLAGRWVVTRNARSGVDRR
jgi:membrane protease YdiL (CAAX protease family)